MRRVSSSPVESRLPPTHGLRHPDASALDDYGVYNDVEIIESLQGRTAKKVTLERAVLRDVDLTNTRLDKLRVLDVRLHNCDLANAAWREASIDRAEFIGCRVTGLDLTEMTGTSLVFRECSGPLASFRFATVKRTKFELQHP